MTASGPSAASATDLLILGARLPGSAQDTPAVALAIQGGRIAAMAPSDQLSHLPAQHTLDARGRTVSPGFIDAHSHLLFYCMALRTVDCRVPLHGSVEEALERLRRQVQAVRPGEWVRGWGYADYKTRERRFPTLAELDDVAPANPIAVLHASWHSAMVNSQALKRMGIDGATPDPAGGAIARDPASGAPTGLLHEAAMGIVSFETMVEEFLQLPREQQLAALAAGSAEFAALGITTSCDAMCKPSLVAIYHDAERQGLLKSRVVAMPYYDWCLPDFGQGPARSFGAGMVKQGAIKLSGDGSLSGRTAAVSEPFLGTGNTGILYRDQQSLERIVLDLDAQGLQIAIHAIGDRAVAQVVAAYSQVIRAGRENEKRHRIEHAGVLSPLLIQSMADRDLVVATQPRMLYEQGDGFLRSCGEQRMRYVYPYRSLIEHGLHVAGSSDCPVVSPNPVLGMRDAVLRRTEEGEELAPGEKLDTVQAFGMFTREAAYSIGEDEALGTLEAGKAADLVLLSADPLLTPAEDWERKVRVELTVVNGEIVHGS